MLLIFLASAAGITSVHGSNLTLLYNPSAFIVDNNGYVYVAESNNNHIVKWTTNYTSGGVCSNVVGKSATQLNAPRDLKFDAEENLYISDQPNNRIQKFMILSCSTNKLSLSSVTMVTLILIFYRRLIKSYVFLKFKDQM